MSRPHARLSNGRPGLDQAGPGLARPATIAERLERSDSLDTVIRRLATAARRAAHATPARGDALHGVWLGQPAHPALSDIPIGCWISATLLDLAPGNERASATLIACGLAGTVPLVATGVADWSVLHQEQQRVGLWHAIGTAGGAALFAASLAARSRGRRASGRLLSAAGLAVLGMGAYLGRFLAFPLAAGASHAEPVAHLAPLGWQDLCRLSELPDGRLTHRRLGYVSLAVLRQGADVLAVADRCGHLGGPLHQGTFADTPDGPCVTCPWHGSTFLLADGSVRHGPATARQPTFETRLAETGMVQVRPAQAAL